MPERFPLPADATDVGRARAKSVLAVFVASLAMGILLLVAFNPDVQTYEAAELAASGGEARAFLFADYVFILLYAAASPIILWGFAAALGGRSETWIKLGAALLVAGGLVDCVENTLLITSTDSPARDAVDLAHSLEVPKFVLGYAGGLLAVFANFRAIQLLRGGADRGLPS